MNNSTTKNHTALIVGIVVVVIAALAFGGFKGKQYYDERYTGQTYYARVPVDASVTLDNLLDSDGNVADTGHDYDLVGYAESGKTTRLQFALRTANADELYTPGTYLKAEASPTLVLSQQPIAEDQVPLAVRELLQ